MGCVHRPPRSQASCGDWQRSLSLGYDKVGDVLMEQGKFDDALKSYQESHAIASQIELRLRVAGLSGGQVTIRHASRRAVGEFA